MRPPNMQPPNFSPRGLNSAPIIGQQQQQQKAQLLQAVGQLSIGIYSQLAAQVIVAQHEGEPIPEELLRSLARDCHQAAKCYFEGLGVATFQQPEKGEDNAQEEA